MDFHHNATKFLNVIHSARIHSGIAAKISTTECCFTNATEMQTKRQKLTINIFIPFDAALSFNHVEAIPIEYATCMDGQTFVHVSILYSNLIISVKILSLTNTSGLKS